MKNDHRIDSYIENAPDFAKEIITHLRSVISRTLPEAQETIKWNSPHFIINNEIVCAIMAFKNHLTFTFWRGQELSDPYKFLEDVGKTKMRRFKNIKTLSDLPSELILSQYMKEAKNLIELKK